MNGFCPCISSQSTLFDHASSFQFTDLCEGDCDRDEDCKEGLECHQRGRNGPGPPPCADWEDNNSKTDFCVPAGTNENLNQDNDGGDDDGANMEDTDIDTDTILNAETAAEEPPLAFVQEENSEGFPFPLGLCQGVSSVYSVVVTCSSYYGMLTFIPLNVQHVSDTLGL